ncbi:hypothetical protein ACSQ67_009743 [Phaseolus vulgaris]
MTSCLSLKELPHNFDMLQSLTNLDMDGCPQLRNFLTKLTNMGEPTLTFGNIQSLNLENCGLETFEGWELQVMVPGTRVPAWFDHVTKGEYMTFWVREKFPAIIICFVLEVESEMKKIFNCEIRFYINGEEVYELEIPRSFSDMVADHVWLYDLRTHSSIHLPSLDLYLMDGWNQVEISCEKISGASNVSVSWCGVHVCKQEANMEDILLTDPDADLDSESEKSIRSTQDSQYCRRVDDNCYIFNNLEGCETPDIAACHTGTDQNQDKNLLHEKTLNGVTKDSMLSLPHEDIGGVKASGSNMLVSDHLVKAQPQSQVTSFTQTPQNSNRSTMVLPTTVEFLENQTSLLTIDDGDMEAFYAVLDDEISVVSLNNDFIVVSELANKRPSEETKKALKTLQDCVTKQFSALLGPEEYSTMKDTLEYLTNLPAEDGISVEIRSLIIQVSRQFTDWSRDYTCESKKIESTTAKLLKADELEKCLEANKTHFKEVVCMENELCNELAYLEERKRELEEQINGVKANISASQAAKNMATQRKREVFGEAKILKAQRDELREQVPHLRDEHELAKKIQSNIRDEWSKLGEKFNYGLRHGKIDEY